MRYSDYNSLVIVCDTNVWYNLGSANLLISNLTSHQLLATGVTLNELAFSGQIKNIAGHYYNSINAIIRYSKHMSSCFPEEHFLKIAGYADKTECELNVMKRKLNDVASLEMSDFIRLSQRPYPKELQKSIESRNQIRQDFADRINSEIPKIKSKIESKGSLQDYRKSVNGEGIRQLLREWIDHFIDNFKISFKIDWDNFPWEKIELLTSAWLQFFTDLETGTSIINRNDYDDLWNLTYVAPGQKYLTFDKKWNQIIYKCGCKNYLTDIFLNSELDTRRIN